MRFDFLELLGPALSFAPRLESYEKESVIAGTHETEQAETYNAGRVFDSRRVRKYLLHFFGRFVGALKRSSVGELHVDVAIALVFIRQKARRHFATDKCCRDADDHEKRDYDYTFSNQGCAYSLVALGGSPKDAIEPIEKSPQQPVALLFRTKQQTSQRRAERESVESR